MGSEPSISYVLKPYATDGATYGLASGMPNMATPELIVIGRWIGMLVPSAEPAVDDAPSMPGLKVKLDRLSVIASP
jgi:hypothetical protein